jgi:hypothetical protein
MNKFKLGVFHCEDCNGSGWGRSQQILMEPVKEPEKPVEKPSGNEWELSE